MRQDSFGRNKEEYLSVIDKYEEIQKAMPVIIQNNSETLYEIANKVNISNSALSNKIHGRCRRIICTCIPSIRPTTRPTCIKKGNRNV